MKPGTISSSQSQEVIRYSTPAHTTERMEEFRHVAGMAHAQGLRFEILSANEMRERHPFLETPDVQGEGERGFRAGLQAGCGGSRSSDRRD